VSSLAWRARKSPNYARAAKAVFSVMTNSIRRNVGVLAVVLCILLGGTWMVAKVTTDHLLYQNATSTARGWAKYLAASVVDLEAIASGEQASTGSMTFFQSAQKSDQVFRYEIFNRNGFSQLVSDHGRSGFVDVSQFSADAARSILTGQAVVGAREGTLPEQPSYYAEAFVPVVVDGRAVAVVAAYVNQTEQRNSFYRTFLIAAAALCMLTALSFTIPTVAWYRRSKEKQLADRRIHFLAHHDALTGLANRASLIEKMDKALAALPSHGKGLAVYFIDCDHFKSVNDTLGHEAGDFLLKAIAERLRSVTRIDDVIARLGGDEFVVLQTHAHSKEQVEMFATRLKSTFAETVKYKDHDIAASLSIGIAVAPADGQTPQRILKSADLALYKAKADGRNCIRFFVPEMDSELLERIELERMIREAVANDGFQLHYQPLYEMTDRRLIGFEALIRMTRKDGTLIPPLTFIPVAEDMRLIGKIGTWVLREACRTAMTWPDHLTVAVNLSPAQFDAGSVSAMVAAALEETGLAAHRLELEITETLLLGDTEAIMAELRALKAAGVSIVMDDFGTGYSSLSYLWRFPFDKIKIDRSFMQGFDGSDRDAETVVKTIIALGRELKMRVTVEGVETAKQAAFLDDASGDQAQGFYFGRPVSASEIGASILADFQRQRPTNPAAKLELAV
jgi:diguanylate cyclase (GGDEF)-like protein